MASRIASQRIISRAFFQHVQIRGMATERQIANKIVSTKNIKKITSSMKMVSAAKLKGDQTRIELAVPFNAWTTAVSGEPKIIEDDTTFDEFPQKVLLVPFTTDKGLCGGVNSYISRSTRNICQQLDAEGKEANIVVVGDKGRAQMRRTVGDKIIRSATDVVSPGTFSLASGLASELIAVGARDYDAVVLIYNHYVNPAVYKQAYKVIAPMMGEGESEPMIEYEFEPDTKGEVMHDLYEYLLTSQIYHSFIDAAAAEQSARMAAMENASKNAGDMIESLTLQYNRARQGRITTELIEIISGAAALEG